jgi:hypothetical protein
MSKVKDVVPYSPVGKKDDDTVAEVNTLMNPPDITPALQTKISNLEAKIWNFKKMNWVMSVFSGMMNIITYSNLYFVKTTLQKNAAQYTEFDSFTKSAWILKPLLGYTSDSFFPFQYR